MRRSLSRTSLKRSTALGIILSLLFFAYFLAVTQDILVHDPFVEADIRLMNLIADLRTGDAAWAFLFFTYLGNWQIIVTLGACILVILALMQEKQKMVFAFVTVMTGEIAYTILKNIIHRARPEIAYSLIPRDGYAFPSGHAVVSIIFYGIIGYFLLGAYNKRWQKYIVIASTSILIFLIGFSRVYLGVHWVSDVIAGWSIGFAILCFSLTMFRLQKNWTKSTSFKKLSPQKILIVCLLLLFETLFILYFYATHPIRTQTPPQTYITNIESFGDLENTIASARFAKFSETIIGTKMEPASFIVIGSKEKLTEAFTQAGWFIADEPDTRSLLHLARVALLNKPYPTAPVTPAFFDTRPQVIAFEKPTSLNSPRERHHTRFWKTQYSYNGNPIWVSTASFDSGLRYLVTHQIIPNIDDERDFIKQDLLKTGIATQLQELQLVPPHAGENQIGDKFYTDGKAYILALK